MVDLVRLVVVLALGAVFVVYNAFVIWCLWSWFMVPFGLPEISVAWAVGLSAFASSLQPVPPKRKGGISEAMITLSLAPLVCLSVGWVAKSFM